MVFPQRINTTMQYVVQPKNKEEIISKLYEGNWSLWLPLYQTPKMQMSYSLQRDLYLSLLFTNKFGRIIFCSPCEI